MDAHDSLIDDQAEEVGYRERATALLDEVAQLGREVLQRAGIHLDIFFIVPASGDAIVTLGAAVNQGEWQEMKSVVSSIVRRSIGLEPAQCREIICAIAHSGDAGDAAMSAAGG